MNDIKRPTFSCRGTVGPDDKWHFTTHVKCADGSWTEKDTVVAESDFPVSLGDGALTLHHAPEPPRFSFDYWARRLPDEQLVSLTS